MQKQLFTFAITALTASISSQVSYAQSWPVEALFFDGDNIAGVGNVTTIGHMVVNNNGDWVVVVDTDNSDVNVDNAILSNSGALYQEGQSLPLPVGALLGSFDDVTIDDGANNLHNYFLDGTTGSSDDSGLYFNDSLLIQEGSVSNAPGFSPGTIYKGVLETKLAPNGQAVILTRIDDPAIPSSFDQALVRLSLSPSGSLLSESVIAKEGDPLGGGLITSFGNSNNSLAINSTGGLIYLANTDLGPGVDSMIVLDGVPIAVEGGPAPIPGELWSSFSSSVVEINDAGDYAYTGRMQGSFATDTVLVHNGTVIAREGDELPGLPGSSLSTFGNTPVKLSADGSILWMVIYNSSTANGLKALFLNDQVIVLEGVTTVGGVVIEDLKIHNGALDFSENGLYVIFEGDLENGPNAAFMARKHAASATLLPGCGSVTGSMQVTSGLPALGTTMELSFSQAQSSAALTYILASATPDPDPLGCGTLVPGIGTALIGLTPTPELIPLGLFTGADLVIPVAIPNDASLVGLSLYTQGLFASPSTPAELFRLTNGQILTFGL